MSDLDKSLLASPLAATAFSIAFEILKKEAQDTQLKGNCLPAAMAVAQLAMYILRVFQEEAGYSAGELASRYLAEVHACRKMN